MKRHRVLFHARVTLVISLGALGVAKPLRSQSAGELTVKDAATTTLTSPLTLTGDAFPLAADDLAFEGASQRNALVIHGESELTLADGAAVTVANSHDLTAFVRVGYGSAGALVIEDGASLTVGSATRYANVQIGQGTYGTVTQTGGTFTSIGSFNVGVNGGTGAYSISGGTLIFDNAGPLAANRTSLISIGFNNATAAAGTSTGAFRISGGLVDVQAPHDGGVINFIIGNRALNALAAYNNGVVTTAGAGNGVVNQTGGTFRVGAGAGLYLSAYGNGVFNLDGGVLEIGGASLQARYGNHTGYTYAFNFGSGTLKVIDSELVTAVDMNLTAGATATIDTNGFGATLSGNLTAAGEHQIDYGGNALVKTGAGTLTFSGSTRVLDTFAITGGALRQTAGATSSVEFMIGTANGNTGTFVMEGGRLTIKPSTKANGDAVTGSLRVGDFGGTGTFTQNAGEVTMLPHAAFHIGNQGGSGTYTLNGGTLTLNGALHVLGRSAAGNPVSHGTLNLAGGLYHLQDGGSLINGNNMPNGAAGSGTINQTGGVLRVDGGARFYLSGGATAGTGTYNLSGGTLEIGGSASLFARYNNSVTTYAFNLGGGTIKVIDSALSTAVNATLVSATTSTIDTNGFGATWSGAFSGAGTLRKTGAQTLTLTGTGSEFGALQVEQGTALVSAGSTVVGRLLVGATGTGSSGSFELTGGAMSTTGSHDASLRVTAIGSGTGNSGTALISGGTLEIGLASTPSTRADFEVGSFGGTGTVTQTGGAVTLNSNGGYFHLGNQGTGVYSLSAGSLTMQNAFALGRSTASGLGNGTLNISGGSLTLASSSAGALIVGGVDGAGTITGGRGTINQTGGTVVVGKYLELGTRGGHGVYNLEGGVLEIGGANGLKRDATGTYAFNLGGGTLRVGSGSLTSSLAMTLTNGTVSTIDTNGLGATFSGAWSGGGGLNKTGAGALTFTGASTFSGATSVDTGSLLVDGSLANSIVSVGSGATLGGHGSVAGVNLLAGGQLAPGGTPGSFTITGDLSLAGTSRVLLVLASGASYDRIDVGGTLLAGGQLEVVAADGFSPVSGASFDLFDGAFSGTFASVTLPTLGAGLVWDTADLYGTGVIAVTTSAIPEPATWAALLGGLALAAAGWWRWRAARGLRPCRA